MGERERDQERGRTSGESGGLLVAQLHGNRGLEAMEKRSCWRARANESEVLHCEARGNCCPQREFSPPTGLWARERPFALRRRGSKFPARAKQRARNGGSREMISVEFFFHGRETFGCSGGTVLDFISLPTDVRIPRAQK